MHGKTFAMVSVAAVVLALVFSLALPIEAATSAYKPGNPKEENAVEAQLHLGPGSPQCLLCFTCGRSWPVFKFSLNQLSSVATYELGPLCAPDPFAPALDNRPFWQHDSAPQYCCNF
jgi:hypothetical protein